MMRDFKRRMGSDKKKAAQTWMHNTRFMMQKENERTQ